MSYHTDNLTVAAALQCLGHLIARIELAGRKATFFFKEDLTQLALQIEMDNQRVPPMRMHQEVRRLSSLARTMAGDNHG
jgi:hypothetical protein